MAKDRKGLVSLIDDLMQEKEVRARFNRSPIRVAKDYDLSDVQLSALFRMKPSEIAKAIAKDLSDYRLDEDEWPKTGPEYFPLPGEADPSYPSPKPWAFRFSPMEIQLPPGGGDFELTVFGQSFMNGNTEIELRRVGAGPNLAVTGFKMYGTFRCCAVRCSVTFPAATGQDQNFEVWVLSPKRPALPTFPNANDFRATAAVLKIKP